MLRPTDRQNFRGQRVLLVGLGLHGGGAATARWLLRRGATLRITDRKSATELHQVVSAIPQKHVTFHLGGHRPADFRWAEWIVVNPAVSPKLPELRTAERHGIPVENEASLFVRRFPGRLIGVTGTRGKTTTTLLLGAMLRRAHRRTIISGNVRQVPMLEHLPACDAETWAVLELSSYQLERLPVEGRPFHVAVLTNLLVDHLDRHGSVAAYAALKRRLFVGQGAGDYAVLNATDPWSRRIARRSKAQVRWFGRNLPSKVNGVTISRGWVVEQEGRVRRRLFPLRTWTLPGEHNMMNLLAAVAAARCLRISTTDVRAVAGTFSGAPDRQERIGILHGHPMINDTTATSPDGTLAALAVYPHGLFIVGGTDKSLDFSELARALVRGRTPLVFLPGTATFRLQAALRRAGYHRPFVTVSSMASAIEAAERLAEPKQPIVLSPGAASFGLFLHEFDRGEHFRRVVSARR